MDSLNKNQVGLRFTYEISEKSLSFLDVRIEKDRRGYLQTTVFRKPTSTNSLLRWDSHHPSQLRKGIPKGQFLRVRRNCSRIRDYQNQAIDLKNRFQQRGYPSDVLDRANQFALNQDRSKLLIPKQKMEGQGTMRVITTYDERSDEARNILDKFWDILRSDPDLEDVITHRPQVTFRKGRSLRDRLIHSHYSQKKKEGTWLDRQPIGTFRCGSNCIACPRIHQGKKIVSSNTGRIFYQRHFSNCKTSGVIYLCTCSCPQDYVGKTTRQFRRRIGEHLGDIKHKRDTSVARHCWEFHNGRTEDITFQVIEVILPSERRGNHDRLLLQKEVEWIHRLKSMKPMGLNESMQFGCFI